jgi:hypothetical protein
MSKTRRKQRLVNGIVFRGEDLTGYIFGRLTVVSFSGVRKNPGSGMKSMWRCRCACGVEKDVCAAHLKHGQTVSCGCYYQEIKPHISTTHGGSRHGSCEPLYSIWTSMHTRCYNERSQHYKRYGGRGIKVCERWHDYALFRDDMSPGYLPGKVSIDRKDNDGDYCLENCRWATDIQQQRNTSRNRNMEFNGEIMCATAWNEKMGYSRNCILKRLAAGWSEERAITTPMARNSLKYRKQKQAT